MLQWARDAESLSGVEVMNGRKGIAEGETMLDLSPCAGSALSHSQEHDSRI